VIEAKKCECENQNRSHAFAADLRLFKQALRDDRSFDHRFWQKQEPQAIFDAAYDIIKDYLLIRDNYAGEPRLQRTIESIQKA